MAMNSMSSVRLISLDLGTSAVKDVVTDVRGMVLATAGADTSFVYPGGLGGGRIAAALP